MFDLNVRCGVLPIISGSVVDPKVIIYFHASLYITIHVISLQTSKIDTVLYIVKMTITISHIKVTNILHTERANKFLKRVEGSIAQQIFSNEFKFI